MSKSLHRPSPEVFWPKWQVKHRNGNILPEHPVGPQRGTIADQQNTAEARPGNYFRANTDIMFINNYVFEHCENPHVSIDYLTYNDVLPTMLTLVQNVAIHASCLLLELDEGDEVWAKQLRFILSNFPNVKRIHILATAVLDTVKPSACPLPYEVFTTEAIGLGDRMRLGILEDPEDLKMCPRQGERPGNFVIQAWDDLEARWPMWKKRKEKAPQIGESDRTRPAEGVKIAPELWILGVAFFSKEWVSMEKDGEHGSSCKLVEAKLNPAVKAAVKIEKEARLASKRLRRTSTAHATRLLQTNFSARPSLGKISSTTSLKSPLPFHNEAESTPPLPKMPSLYSLKLQWSAKSQLNGRPPHQRMPSSFSVQTERLPKGKLEARPAKRKATSEYALTKKGSLFSLTAKSSAPAPSLKGRTKKT